MVSMLAWWVVDRVLETWSGQTKHYQIGICWFCGKHVALIHSLNKHVQYINKIAYEDHSKYKREIKQTQIFDTIFLKDFKCN